MADQKVTALTAKSTLDGTELAYIVDDPSGTPISKKTTTQAIANLAGGYLEYVVLLKQTGTDAPVDTVLKNQLSGTPVWTRVSAGQYRCTLTGAFTVNKTVCIEGSIASGDSVFANPVNANTVDVYTTSAGIPLDELLGGFSGSSKTPLIIRIYL